MIKRIFLIFTFLLTPAFCLAQQSFVISEIMLNPEGSDSGREWIEVTNLGAGTGVDDFKFREGPSSADAVSHSIKIPDDKDFSFIIARDESFVIADNPEKFKIDYPNYEGKYFDSSFSLTNSGEYLSLLDENKNILFEIDVEDSLIGDEGQSICLVNDIWKNCIPNPGRDALEGDVVESGLGESEVQGEVEEPAQSAGSDQTVTSEQDNQGVDQPVVNQTFIEIKNPDYREKVIKADGGGDRIVLAGSEFLFEAKSFGLLGTPLRDPKYNWNFGDGKTEKGNRALHVYHYPGEYNATLSAKTEKYSSVDRFKIKVIEPDLKISEISFEKQFIKIINNTFHDLDISYFNLASGKIDFEIPEGTFVDSGGEITFPSEYTEIDLIR